MKPNGLIEVIFYVKDMQSMVSFYRDILGLKVATPTGLVDYQKQHWMTFDTGACILALHSGGQGSPGQSATTIVFNVEDIQAARDHLLGHGVKAGELHMVSPGVWVVDSQDPEGNWFSLQSHESPIVG